MTLKSVLANNGIRIPGWVIAAVIVTTVVLGTGFRLGRTYETVHRSVQNLEIRMCRIEQALNVPIWPTCKEP